MFLHLMFILPKVIYIYYKENDKNKKKCILPNNKLRLVVNTQSPDNMDVVDVAFILATSLYITVIYTLFAKTQITDPISTQEIIDIHESLSEIIYVCDSSNNKKTCFSLKQPYFWQVGRQVFCLKIVRFPGIQQNATFSCNM